MLAGKKWITNCPKRILECSFYLSSSRKYYFNFNYHVVYPTSFCVIFASQLATAHGKKEDALHKDLTFRYATLYLDALYVN
jgi:hypothetical protein